MVHVAVPVHETHERGAEVAERGGLVLPAEHVRLVPGDGALDGGDRLGHAGEDPVADLGRERRRDAARDDPLRMDPLAAQPLDDLLAPLAERDAVLGQLGVLPGHAQDVANGRVRVEAEQEVRR